MLVLVVAAAISNRPTELAQPVPLATSTLKMSLLSPLLIPKLACLVGVEARCPGAEEEERAPVAEEVRPLEAEVVLVVVVQRHVDILPLEGGVLGDHNSAGEEEAVDGEIGTRFVHFDERIGWDTSTDVPFHLLLPSHLVCASPLYQYPPNGASLKRSSSLVFQNCA